MASQALYRKWRPKTFEEVVGQDHVVQTLRNAIMSGRIHHAYLFAGPRGTGKTSTARLFAKAVNCLAPVEERPCNKCSVCQAVNEGRLLDLVEIDAASNTGVDDVRALRERIGFRPTQARYKVYVIDEAHMLSTAAFNALLKTLEEPPPHAIFILATTQPDPPKMPLTVLSRCQRLDFHRIPVAKIVGRLQLLSELEGFQADLGALTLIARQSTGCLRDAESLLDQLAAFGNGTIDEATVRAALGTGAGERVLQVIEAVADEDAGGGLNTIDRAIDDGADPRQFARQIVEYLRAMMLARIDPGVASAHQMLEESRAEIAALAERFSPSRLAKLVRLFNQAAREAKSGWQPQLPLELAFVEAVLPADPATPAVPQSSAAPRLAPAPRSVDGSEGSVLTVSGHTGATQPAYDSSDTERTDRGSSSRAATTAGSPAASEGALSASGAGATITVDSLRGQWSALMKYLREVNPRLQPHLRSCKVMDLVDGVVVLGFDYQMNRDKVAASEYKRCVEDALTKLTGETLRLRCVTLDKVSSAASASQPMSAEELLEQDPVVRAAVEDLGARIVPRRK